MHKQNKVTKLVTFRSTIDQIKIQKELANSLGMSITDMIKMAVRRLKYDFDNDVRL